MKLNKSMGSNGTKQSRHAAMLVIISGFYIFFYRVVRSLPWHESGVIYGKNYNLIAYASSLILAFIVTFVFQFVFSLIKTADKALLSFTSKIVGIAAAPCAMLFLWLVYQNESKTPASDMIKVHFLREHFPHLAVVIVMTLLIVGLFRASYITKAVLHSIPHINLRLLFSMQIAFICALLNYGPNTFKNGLWGIFHNHAYTASIISVMCGAPYDKVNTNIYGHYGILYAPFVRLLGDDYHAIALTISVFTFVIFLCAFLCTNKLIDNNTIYYTTVVAIASINVTYYKPGQALAVMPHRYLFPLLGLTYVICMRNKIKNRLLKLLVEYTIGSLAIVFNIETGIGTVLAIASVRLFDIFRDTNSGRGKKGYLTLAIKRVIHQVLFIVLCFIIAWGIVDVYNVTVGGELLPLSLFLYPYGSRDYVISNELTLPIPTTKASYMLHIITFSYAVFTSLYDFAEHTWNELNDETVKAHTPITFDYKKVGALAIGISGLISLSYYMNRTALGQISICHIHFILLLALYSDDWIHIEPNHFKPSKLFRDQSGPKLMKSGLSAVAFYLVAWFAIEGVFSFGGAFETRIASIWDTESLSNSISAYSEAIPEDMVAFGLGMPEIEYCAGRKPKIVLSEWSNTNRYSEDKILGILDECDTFAVTERTRLTIPDSFRQIRRLDRDEFSIVIYQRK